MARRGVSQERQRASMIQAGQRMIARGERPSYRIESHAGGRWRVVGAEPLSVSAPTRRAAVAAARTELAAMLEVEPDRFDVEG